MIKSVQNWLPFDKIYDNGIIKLKDNSFIKILKIIPINYNLKSTLEKEAILNSYKLFLKTCNFDIQILIQSNKENINKVVQNIKENIINENENIKNIANEYSKYIKSINANNKISSKKFFILIKITQNKLNENLAKDELNNNYFKIKECLSRCGNNVYSVSSKYETEELLYSFFNTKRYINNINEMEEI